MRQLRRGAKGIFLLEFGPGQGKAPHGFSNSHWYQCECPPPLRPIVAFSNTLWSRAGSKKLRFEKSPRGAFSNPLWSRAGSKKLRAETFFESAVAIVNSKNVSARSFLEPALVQSGFEKAPRECYKRDLVNVIRVSKMAGNVLKLPECRRI